MNGAISSYSHVPAWMELLVDGRKVLVTEDWPPDARYPYTSSRAAAASIAQASKGRLVAPKTVAASASALGSSRNKV